MLAQTPPSLNPAQEKAVQAPDRPLLIVAGAGTGKTRTLTMRILYLLSRGVPAGSILGVTFTNKAAREIESRVLAGLQKAGGPGTWGGENPPFLGTFHSLGSRILRREAHRLGRTANFAIFDDQDSFQLVKKVAKGLGLADTKSRSARRGERGPAFLADRISRIKNGMLAADLLEESHPDGALIAAAYEDYEKELVKQNAFDFDDLIEKVVRLLKANPDILAGIRARFTHVLVDEYQDVNNMQYELVRLIVGDSGRVSVVGDDAQTIFSWRGSNFEIFLNFERDWPNAQVVVLDQNYRSSKHIIAGASAVIAENQKQKQKNLWTENDEGSKIRLIETLHEDEEAEWIANQIAEEMIARSAEGEAPRSTAILYRTNAQSRAIEQALVRHRVPYRVYGGLKFYERKEIRDAVAALRITANPKDDVSRERLEKAISKTRLARFVEALGTVSAREPAALINLFLETTGYLDLLERTETNVRDRKENIAELIVFAGRFNALPQMIEELTLLQATDAVKGARNNRGAGGVERKEKSAYVELMTMHLAKGLEFDRVFVAGVSEGLLPHARATSNDAELEEERRLLYVAMTRARHDLTLSFYDLPSRFLSAIPERHLAFTSLTSDAQTFEDDEERAITLD